MTNAELSSALRAAADAIETLPESVLPISVDFYFGESKIHLRWNDFNRVFTKAKYWRDDSHERIEATAGGVLWHACNRLPESEPREVTLRGVIAGDGGDDDLALAIDSPQQMIDALSRFPIVHGAHAALDESEVRYGE